MKILNSKGEPITLNERELRIAQYNQQIVNALGYEVATTTLTTVIKKVSEQRFYLIPPSDYMPVRVGEGAWSSNLVTYRSFALGDDFATGVLGVGASTTRLAAADAGIDSVTAQITNWAKTIGYSLFDLQFATKSGSWDLVTAKEKARKRNWDLGIQKLAFLGLDAKTEGLLNLTGVNTNSSLITKKISSMSTTELKTFVAGLVDAYRVNCNRTAWPTHFIIPESDYLGLAAPASADFPIRSVLSVLEETLQTMTMNKGFKVLPLAYADEAYNSLDLNVYTLLNYDEESLRMDIPVDYTSTLQNSIDNFNFQNVAYGQFTGVRALRPLEILYFTYDA